MPRREHRRFVPETVSVACILIEAVRSALGRWIVSMMMTYRPWMDLEQSCGLHLNTLVDIGAQRPSAP